MMWQKTKLDGPRNLQLTFLFLHLNEPFHLTGIAPGNSDLAGNHPEEFYELVRENSFGRFGKSGENAYWFTFNSNGCMGKRFDTLQMGRMLHEGLVHQIRIVYRDRGIVQKSHASVAFHVQFPLRFLWI